MYYSRKSQIFSRQLCLKCGRLFHALYIYIGLLKLCEAIVFLNLQHFSIKLGSLANFKMLFRVVVKAFIRHAWIKTWCIMQIEIPFKPTN